MLPHFSTEHWCVELQEHAVSLAEVYEKWEDAAKKVREDAEWRYGRAMAIVLGVDDKALQTMGKINAEYEHLRTTPPTEG